MIGRLLLLALVIQSAHAHPSHPPTDAHVYAQGSGHLQIWLNRESMKCLQYMFVQPREWSNDKQLRVALIPDGMCCDAGPYGKGGAIKCPE